MKEVDIGSVDQQGMTGRVANDRDGETYYYSPNQFVRMETCLVVESVYYDVFYSAVEILEEEEARIFHEKQAAPFHERQVVPFHERQVVPFHERQVVPFHEKQGVSFHEKQVTSSYDV